MNTHRFLNISKALSLVLIATVMTVSCSVNSSSEDDGDEMYISIPDAQFEQLLIERGIDSEGVLDQQILKSNAESITHLDLNWAGGEDEIRNLTGIEGFVNLTALSAARQEIERIDLSSNTRLDTLYLAGNILQEIDLSANTELIHVNLGTNELTAIEGLSALEKLKTLDLSWNYLEDLTIANSSVEILFLNLNELRNLDISQAAGLKSLVVTSNRLTGIDLRTNTRLETVVMSNNAVETVDLSQNAELTYFYASSNALKALDVSSNANLIDLRVDRNPELICITIHPGQEIPTVVVSDDQVLSSQCG